MAWLPKFQLKPFTIKVPFTEPIDQTLCVGLLLTGGDSARFGSNKLLYPFGGTSIACMTATSLAQTGLDTYEAGSGLTNFPQIPDTNGYGPLVAIATSYSYLISIKAITGKTHMMILAGDVPLITPSTIIKIAKWSTKSNVVPLINSKEQYLSARWSPASLTKACQLVSQGESRISKAIHDTPTEWVSYESLGLLSEMEFYDIDTREDLEMISRFPLSRKDKGTPDDTRNN